MIVARVLVFAVWKFGINIKFGELYCPSLTPRNSIILYWIVCGVGAFGFVPWFPVLSG